MTPESLMQQLDETYFVQKLELLVKQAYEQGVIAGQKRFNYPPVLKRDDLAEILNIALPTVDKLLKNPSFPRLREIRGRYPRDAVFKWIEDNTEVLNSFY